MSIKAYFNPVETTAVAAEGLSMGQEAHIIIIIIISTIIITIIMMMIIVFSKRYYYYCYFLSLLSLLK